MDDKEKWINDVMKSASLIKEIAPPVDAYTTIARRIGQHKVNNVIPINLVRLAAACFCLLVIGNLWLVANLADKRNATSADVSVIASSMGLLEDRSIFNY